MGYLKRDSSEMGSAGRGEQSLANGVGDEDEATSGWKENRWALDSDRRA